MRLKSQLYIDRTIVKALVLGLNIIVRILGKLLRINHKLNQPFKTFAICKFKGLGSIIQATPLIQTIKQNYPEARIVFITTNSNKKLLQCYPEVDQVITLNDSNTWSLFIGFLPFIVKLIRLRIDNYFDLEIYSNFSSLVTTLSMATNRFGYYLRSSNYRLGIYTHMMYYNVDSPISQTYLQLIRSFPITEEVAELKAPTYTPTQIIQDLNLKEPYLLINPNASDLRLERRWGTDKYIQLLQDLKIAFPNTKLVIVGSPSESEYVQSIVRNCTAEVVNTAGKTSVHELFDLIKNSRLVITNDSGPMHISFALKKQTIGIFGPCSPEQYGSHSFAYPIYNKMYCSPCVHEFEISPCNGNNQCMKLIAVDLVLKKAQEIIESKHLEQPKETNITYRGNDQWTPGFIQRN